MGRRAIIAGGLAATLLVAGCSAPDVLRARRQHVDADPAQLARWRQLSEEAQQAIDRKDWERARAALEQLATETPRSAEVHHRLGRVLESLGRTEDAEIAFHHALALEGDYPDALIGLGQVEARQGRLTAALKHIDAAIELAPGRAEAHLARGRVLEALGRTDDALAAYFRTLGTDPSSAGALRRIAEIQLARKQYDQALARLTHVLELAPDDPDARYDRGRAHLALGHVPEAIDDLRGAASRLPRRADVFFHLGLALERAHQPADALRAAETALQLAPRYHDALDLTKRLRR